MGERGSEGTGKRRKVLRMGTGGLKRWGQRGLASQTNRAYPENWDMPLIWPIGSHIS
jgi:hypothetical protein